MTKHNSSHYDAVIVLGGNIRRTSDGYAPSTYADSDMYGMLGGRIRVIAAALMYLDGWASAFVFSTGTSEKTKAVFGSEVPTEAVVYSEDFKATLMDLSGSDLHENLQIVLEDRSQNTAGNIRECLEIIRDHGWQKVAFVSTWPHLRRAEALCSIIAGKTSNEANLEFISAEDIVRQLRPGEYDAEIDAAYSSDEGKKRIANEAKGVQDAQDGTYVMTEYQLHSQPV